MLLYNAIDSPQFTDIMELESRISSQGANANFLLTAAKTLINMHLSLCLH